MLPCLLHISHFLRFVISLLFYFKKGGREEALRVQNVPVAHRAAVAGLFYLLLFIDRQALLQGDPPAPRFYPCIQMVTIAHDRERDDLSSPAAFRPAW